MSEHNGKYAPLPGKIPGVAINLGGHVLYLAPLGLRLARELEERAKALRDRIQSENKPTTDEMHALHLWAIHSSILRNYPEISLGEVEELVDAGNIAEAMDAILTPSGLKRVAPGETPPVK